MVLWVDRRKKGSGEPLRKIKKNSWHSWWSDYLGVERAEGLVPCEGKVEIESSVSDGCPCCSGPEIDIEYRCDACDCTFYPELPQNTGDLEDLLNEGVITQTRNKGMQEAYIKAHEEAEEKRRKMLEEHEARIAKNRAAAAEKKKLIAEAKAARKKAAAAKKKAKKA
jgi:hypothetical protein